MEKEFSINTCNSIKLNVYALSLNLVPCVTDISYKCIGVKAISIPRPYRVNVLLKGSMAYVKSYYNIMSSNPVWAEIGVCSTSILSRT